MRKFVLSIMLLLVVGLLSGQQGCESGGEISDATGPYVGGREGLVMEFLNDAPPSSGNFQGDPIAMEVELTNNGEEEIAAASAQIKLIGAIVGTSFTLKQNDADENAEEPATLVGSNAGSILEIQDASDVPDSDFVNLGSATLDDSAGVSYSPIVRAQICYPYKTYLQVDDLCIPGESRETNAECEIDSAKNLVGNGDVSGAPIQITSVVESRTAEGIRVRLDIENQGNGQATTKTCAEVGDLIGREDQLISVSVPGWDCTYKNAEDESIELRDGKGRLRCRKDNVGGTGRAYIDRLTAIVSYQYVDTTSKTISVQTTL